MIMKNSDRKDFCTPLNPFRLINGECAPFENACYKKDDKQCEELKNACKNCPPSNITLTILQNILNINQNENKRNFEISLSILIVSSIILILAICLVIIKFVYYKQRRNKIKVPVDSEQEPLLLHDNKSIQVSVGPENTFPPRFPSTQVSVDSEQERLLLCEHPSIQGNIKMKFKVPKYNKTIQIYVNSSDNIVKLKKKICKRITKLSPEAYKTMIFKYNGNQLNDNHYLLSYVKGNTVPIYCEFSNNINIKEICVLKIEGKENFPGLLQINRSDKINYLKKIIANFINCECDKLILFHKSVELEIEKTIEECKLKDYYRIYTRKIQMHYVIVNSILEDNKSCPMQYSDDRSIENIKRKLAENFKLDFDKIFLYIDGELMNEKNFLYEYELEDNCIIEYFHPMNADKIQFEIDYNKDYLQICKHKGTNQSILLLQRSFSKIEMKDKLLIYHHCKSNNSSLVNIIGVYQLDDVMHIAIDNIFSGTIVSYLNSNEILLYRIIMWIKQIISGLNYFHENGIYFGYLNPLNILIDGNHHVKILSFKTDLNEFANKMNEKIDINVFVENDICEHKRQPDSQCDVWSLGAILTYITTDKSPEYILENKNTGRIRRTLHTDLINKKDPSTLLKEFILLCMEENLEKRSTLDQLMNHMLMRTRTLRY